MASSRIPDFGALLRDLRTAANLTQEELAARAGMSVRGLSDLERGVYRGPRPYTLRRLEDALRLDEHQRALLETSLRAGAGTLPGGRKMGNFLGANPSGLLIARRDDLARVRLALDSVSRGSGQTVLISGPPGVGKTRLAQEASRLCADAAALVATGRCHQGETGSAFYPFLEVLETAYEGMLDSIRRTIPDRWPYLLPLLPGVVPPILDPGAQDNQQQRLFRAVTGFLQALAQMQPVALLVDDLHWSDGSSLLLFLHLARFTRGDRVLLIGTYRDAEVEEPSPLGRMRAALVREELSETIALGPLQHADTAELIAALVGASAAATFVDVIHERSAGNALFARELVRTLAERGTLTLTGDGWNLREGVQIELPETIRAAIHERVARLAEGDRQVLLEAAVLGDHFDVANLVALHGSPDGIEQALVGACRLGLVYPVDNARYRFDHALTREVLYADLAAVTRRRLHHAAAEAIARDGEPARVAETARHWLHAGEHEKALALSLEAGDRAHAVGAYDEAVQHFRTALDLARRRGETRSEVRALEGLGRGLAMTGPPADAIALLEEAAGRYRASGELTDEARVQAVLCSLHRMVGAGPESADRPLTVLAQMRALPPSVTRARLGIALARLQFALGRYDESRRLASEAARVAARAGGAGVQASAEVRWGIALMELGRLEEARRTLQRAIRRAEMVADHGALSEALRSLTPVHEGLGNLGGAWTSADRAVQIEERFGTAAGLAWAVMLRGQLAQTNGAWDDARRDFRRALDLYAKLPPTIFSAYAGLVIGDLDLLTGERESGMAAVEQALAAFRAHRHRIGIQRAEVTLAELAVREGRPEDAIARLEAWREESSDSEVLFVAPVLAEAYLLAGRCNRARRILEATIEPARSRGYRILEAPFFRVQGQIAAQEGDWEAAGRAFEAALAADSSVPVPFVRARTLHEYGLAEAGRGDCRAARAHLLEALAIFRRLGARPYAQQVEQALTLPAHGRHGGADAGTGRDLGVWLSQEGRHSAIRG